MRKKHIDLSTFNLWVSTNATENFSSTILLEEGEKYLLLIKKVELR